MTSDNLPLVWETRIGAYGICIDDGKLLVIRKARGPYQGRFDLPGGGIEFGESPEATVVREFLEETGTGVIVNGLIGAFSRLNTWRSDAGTKLIEGHHLGFLYRVTQAEQGSPVRTGPDGLDSLGAVWLPLANATPEVISPLVAEGLRLWRGR